MRRALEFAAARDLIEFNPMATMEPAGKTQSRDRVLNDDEIKPSWNAAGPLWHGSAGLPRSSPEMHRRRLFICTSDIPLSQQLDKDTVPEKVDTVLKKGT
ncbi:MAG: hypothetical protein P1P74_07530 [Desulfuromonadales bacterium]|nr:hypothetical protein [Desulfuromonadales bacterium]